MKRLLPLLLVIPLAVGCGCRDELQPETVNIQPNNRKPPQVSPQDPSNEQSPMYGLPLVYEIEAPDVPEEIKGPTAELPKD